MVDETVARLRTHHSNIQRYRQLLETSLTDLERKFIDKRWSAPLMVDSFRRRF